MFELPSGGCIAGESGPYATGGWCGDDCAERTRGLLESHRMERSVFVASVFPTATGVCEALPQRRPVHSADGSGRYAVADIGKAAGVGKAVVRISAAGNPFRVHVDVSGAGNAEVFVALALNEAVSRVMRGENGGRQLRHVAVVQSLTQVGKVKSGESFSKDVDVPGAKQADVQRYRIVAFVQERGQSRVLGAASFRPAR